MRHLNLALSIIMTTSILVHSQVAPKPIGTYTYLQVREALLEHRETALLDVREEAPFAEAHPLFAANIPFSRLELEVYNRIPRRNTTIVVYDNGEGLASKSANRLLQLGYTQVHLLKDGLEGWKSADGELFKDVNVPSKSFGELVESKRHTPMLSAPEVKVLLDAKADVVVLDVRRFDEYQTMNIPGSTSVPGAELVLRARELAPRPETKIIVNCAGRTRSIIGTQSLINAGIPNQVVALRNGTIGWTLAGQELEHGANRRFVEASAENKAKAIADSRKVADQAGVKRTTLAEIAPWLSDPNRTTYRFDVRTPEEYAEGHLPGFRSTPGGQLVQETDHSASVRGARIVLADDQNNVRANMTSSWLAQMGWEVYVLDNTTTSDYTEKGKTKPELPAFPNIPKSKLVTATTLAQWLNEPKTVVVDLATEAQYNKQHISGAWYALRSQFADAINKLPKADRYILTSPDGTLARFAFSDFQELTNKEVFVLEGGTNAWVAEKHPVSSEAPQYASPQIDRYRRPYEGTKSSVKAMEDYLEWEYGLVEQLRKDGTHGFSVL